MKPQILPPTVVAFLCFLAFQSCGGGFDVLQNANSLQASSVLTNDPNISSDPDSEEPEVTTSPSPASNMNVFFARSGGMDGIHLDLENEEVTDFPSTAFSGAVVGWMAYEESSKSVVAAEYGQGKSKKLQIYSYDPLEGTLTSKKILSVAASTSHLLLVKMSDAFHLFGSSYDEGRLDHYVLDFSLSTNRTSQTLNFGVGSKAHSSAFDSVRKLLFVATLGINKISVYRLTDGGLIFAGDISLPAPRTVVYDSLLDKLYVATEASSGSSYIRAFSIQENVSGTYTFTDVGSQAMPLTGADLKVNHAQGFVMATARQVGQESLWGMPITESGIKDTTRSAFSIPISQVQPRALELSEDGRYAVVAMDSPHAENVVIFKLNFDGDRNFVSSQKIWSKRIGTSGYGSSLSLPSSK